MIRFFILALLALMTTPVLARSSQDDLAKAEIARQVDAYLTSIDAADVTMARSVWLPTPDVSFIHPRGEERGFEQISQNFYTGLMGGMFSKRKLRRVGDLDIAVYGQMAVVMFKWDFVASWKANGQELNTKGRESQVFRKFPKLGWRLVHVHYSGLPVTEAGRGF